MFYMKYRMWIYEIEARLLECGYAHIARDWFKDNGLIWC